MVVDDSCLGVAEFPFGVGLGLGQPGGLHSVGLKMERFIESEWGRIAYEVGVLGLIGALRLRVVAAWMMWRGLRSTTNPTRRLVLAAALPMFVLRAGNDGIQSHGQLGGVGRGGVVVPAVLPERGPAGAKRASGRGMSRGSHDDDNLSNVESDDPSHATSDCRASMLRDRRSLSSWLTLVGSTRTS